MMKGYIHSFESMGTVDGPGIRFVVFLQGCPLRCLYCHNPDTWDLSKGKCMDSSEIINECQKYSSFIKSGGITLTGGEPLLQMEFITEICREAKKRGIHTCIDTSGAVFDNSDKKKMKQFEELLSYVDLILLDIKHINSEEHKHLTGLSNENILDFANYLSEKNIPVWIRHVVVPGITDDKVQLRKLGNFIGTLTNVKALDVLPYHDMGKVKYEQLGIDYPLKDVSPLSKEAAISARDEIIKGIRDVKKI